MPFPSPQPGPLETTKDLMNGDFIRCTENFDDLPGHQICRVQTVLDDLGIRVHEYDGSICVDRFTFIGRPTLDGWMDWPGGMNPVPGRWVEVTYKTEHGGIAPANGLRWFHVDMPSDIVRFRIVEAPGQTDFLVDPEKVPYLRPEELRGNTVEVDVNDLRAVCHKLRLLASEGSPLIYSQRTALERLEASVGRMEASPELPALADPLQIVEKRLALYREKQAQHDSAAVDTVTEWEKIEHTIEAMQHMLLDMSAVIDQSQPEAEKTPVLKVRAPGGKETFVQVFVTGDGWQISAVPARPTSIGLLCGIGDGRDFQSRVGDWMHRCFGADITNSFMERCWRFAEEAGELVQSLGMTQQQWADIGEYVWHRDVGETPQELGGVMVTLAALSHATHLSMSGCGEVELARIDTPATIDKIRKKHHDKVLRTPTSPLPGADQ